MSNVILAACIFAGFVLIGLVVFVTVKAGRFTWQCAPMSLVALLFIGFGFWGNVKMSWTDKGGSFVMEKFGQSFESLSTAVTQNGNASVAADAELRSRVGNLEDQMTRMSAVIGKLVGKQPDNVGVSDVGAGFVPTKDSCKPDRIDDLKAKLSGFEQRDAVLDAAIVAAQQERENSRSGPFLPWQLTVTKDPEIESAMAARISSLEAERSSVNLSINGIQGILTWCEKANP